MVAYVGVTIVLKAIELFVGTQTTAEVNRLR